MKHITTLSALVIALAALIVASSSGASSNNKNAVEVRVNAGIGSTTASMKSAHGRARGPGEVCSATNSCFGSPLRNDESGDTFQFTNVLVAAGLITGYGQNFVRGTSSASALSQVLEWLPKGSVASRVTVDHIGGSCGFVTITSPALAKVLSAPKIGDPSGVIGVDLEYINANLDIVYNPNNVEDAQVEVGAFSPKDSC
jgi:hypothetical protein